MFQHALFLILSHLVKATRTILWGCYLQKKMVRHIGTLFPLPLTSSIWTDFLRVPEVQCGDLVTFPLSEAGRTISPLSFPACIHPHTPSSSGFSPLLWSHLAQLNNVPFKNTHLVHSPLFSVPVMFTKVLLFSSGKCRHMCMSAF